MSNFNYEKYNEITGAVNFLGEKMKEVDEKSYKSTEVETMANQLISIGNRLQAYIRHSKK